MNQKDRRFWQGHRVIGRLMETPNIPVCIPELATAGGVGHRAVRNRVNDMQGELVRIDIPPQVGSPSASIVDVGDGCFMYQAQIGEHRLNMMKAQDAEFVAVLQARLAELLRVPPVPWQEEEHRRMVVITRATLQALGVN